MNVSNMSDIDLSNIKNTMMFEKCTAAKIRCPGWLQLGPALQVPARAFEHGPHIIAMHHGVFCLHAMLAKQCMQTKQAMLQVKTNNPVDSVPVLATPQQPNG